MSTCMSGKAILTREGARRLGWAELAGEIIYYDSKNEACINNVFYRLSRTLSYVGKEKGCVLINEEEDGNDRGMEENGAESKKDS